MKRGSLSFTLVVFALMAGCSTMNSDFSCKATASDSCLTIEQVDAMTRFADGADLQYRPRKTVSKQRPVGHYLTKKDNDQPIWVAPWKDKSGKPHEAARLYAGRLQQKILG